ncbi:MAG: hypothetical protein AB7U73_07520 [Pirellulales bacterium]
MDENSYRAPAGQEPGPKRRRQPWRALANVGGLTMLGGFLLGVFQVLWTYEQLAPGAAVYRISVYPGFIVIGGALLLLVAVVGWLAT